MLDSFRSLFAPPRHLILFVLAMWLGVALAEKRALKYNISKDQLNNIFFYSLLGFIIGGRLSFVLQNISAFIQSPLSIFSNNLDVFDILGGVATFLILLITFSQRYQVKFWSLLDALTPCFAIISIGLGLSNLASGAAFGLPTDLAWSIQLWNANRHPTQIYQTIASFLIFIWIWLQKHNLPSGILFLIFISLTTLAQFVIGAFRADYTIMFNGIKQEQLYTFILLIISFLLIEIRLKNKPAQ
ncbi:MAG: prolipoprotein diacylglyceryl transferase family protein [Chloroflexi bacterium OLB14]|nr:MAG: prolipoprotein diacylglyceryl transferase family protein [Chloroflexi bacterium OLB14]